VHSKVVVSLDEFQFKNEHEATETNRLVYVDDSKKIGYYFHTTMPHEQLKLVHVHLLRQGKPWSGSEQCNTEILVTKLEDLGDANIVFQGVKSWKKQAEKKAKKARLNSYK
jgi:hypothetical protein